MHGISITTLTGENGIITRARETKKQADVAEAQEVAETAYLEAVMKGGGAVSNDEGLTAVISALRESGHNPVEIPNLDDYIMGVRLEGTYNTDANDATIKTTAINQDTYPNGREYVVSVDRKVNPSAWFSVINGQYYRIRMVGEKVHIDDVPTPSSLLTPHVYKVEIDPSAGNGLAVKVNGNLVTEKTIENEDERNETITQIGKKDNRMKHYRNGGC